jgi:galactonate dehydratase
MVGLGRLVIKITRLETLLANAGLRNYLFVRLTTDTGVIGIGEASLEWQERTVQTILHEWVEDRILGQDPFNIEDLIGRMIRDQYQGGSTVMTAISGVEIAMWDVLGKVCGQPVYRLLGGRCRSEIHAYANGWYGGLSSPGEFAKRAQEVVSLGYNALKFDPFGTAWKDITSDEQEEVKAIVAAVRKAVGPDIKLMLEFHGRLSVRSAIDIIRALEAYSPAWCEEPVTPDSLNLLLEVKSKVNAPIAAGERLYTIPEFFRLTALRAADIVQMDVAHCGGILASKKIAAMAAAQDMRIAPHCSVGPVALSACLHLGLSCPNLMIQEAFGEFDVSWRDDLVKGWNPLSRGIFRLTDQPGLGIDIDDDVIAQHPYKRNPFPSLWDKAWLRMFTQSGGH